MNKLRKTLNADYFYPVLLFVILFLSQIFYILFVNSSAPVYTSEVMNKAKSIASGKGFANPFMYETGPTSWQTFLLPWIVSFFIRLTGITVLTSILLGILGKGLYALSLYFLQKTILRYGFALNRLLLFLIFMAYIAVFNAPHAIIINYGNLSVFAIALTLYFVKDFIQQAKINVLQPIAFIIPLMLTPLVLPFVGLIALVYVFWLIYQFTGKNILNITDNLKFKHFFLIGVAFVMSVGIWTARNYIVFKEIIPSKSNMWFEFYMTNIVDKEGILNNSAWRQVHPMNNEKTCAQIKEKGEIHWMEQFENAGKLYKTEHKDEYRKKMIRRAQNIYIFIDNSYDFISTPFLQQLNDTIKSELELNNVILKDSYLTLQYTDEEMNNLISAIDIPGDIKDSLFKNWKYAKGLLAKDTVAPTRIYHGVLKATLPSLAILTLLILLAVGRIKNTQLILFSVFLYVVYFIPYITISHEIRYQRPMELIQILIVYLFIIQLLELLGLKHIFKLNTDSSR